MEIQEIIKARRIELGLSVREVAQALNVAPSTISRYESSDIQNMGIDKIEALAKVLHCSPVYLMGWNEPTPVPENFTLSSLECEIIQKYRHADSIDKEMVLRILKIEEKGDAEKMA